MVSVCATDSRELIYSTPGFRRVVAAAWVATLQLDDPYLTTLGLDSLTACFNMLLETQCGNVAHAEEFIDGTGGCIVNLAQIVVAYITQVWSPRPADCPERGRTPALLGAVLDFVADIDTALGSDTVGRDGIGPFSTTLLHHGVIRALTLMAQFITHPGSGFANLPGQKTFQLLYKGYAFMDDTLSTAIGQLYIAEALQAGLLRVIVQSIVASKLDGALARICQMTLPKCLLDYYDLRIVDAAFRDVEDMDELKDPAFLSAPEFEPWTNFSNLAHERIAIFKHYASKSPRLRGCDNAKVISPH
jgi:hypothetical protein